MKPEGFKELETPMDLCEVAVEDARRMINGGIIGKYYYYVIKVASQNYSIAFGISKCCFFKPCYVDLDMAYEPDEWSLEKHWFEDKPRVEGVWSPGA